MKAKMETLWPSDYLLKPHVGAAKRKNEGYMWDSYQGRPTRGYRAEPGYTARLLGISLHSFFVQLRPFQTEILNCMNFAGEFWENIANFLNFPSPQGYSNAPLQVQGHQMPVRYRA